MTNSKNRSLFSLSLLCVLLLFGSATFAESGDDYQGADQGTNNEYSLLSVTGAAGMNEGGSQGIQADNFTGAATYSIPIAVPPGRGGIDPKLVLGYSSSRKNADSWVGYGWSLDLGSIVRVTDKGWIDYINGTAFEYRLGGQSETLTLIDAKKSPETYGLSGDADSVDVYSAKIETAYNTYLHLWKGSKDNGWCVIDKSGVKYFFGMFNSSRDQATTEDSQLWIAGWFLDKVVDPNNNVLNVSYDPIQKLPVTIKYDDIILSFETDQANTRYFPIFNRGFLGREHAARLKSITIYRAASGTPNERLQKIKFNYKSSQLNAVSLLDTIVRYGALPDDSEKLPPIKMSYYEGDSLSFGIPEETSLSTGDTGPQYSSPQIFFADMNGDGLVDQLTGFPNYGDMKVRLNTYLGFGAAKIWQDPFVSVQSASGCLFASLEDDSGCAPPQPGEAESMSKHYFAFVMDMNGDALPDRVMGSPENSDGTGDMYFYIAVNEGTGWSNTLKTWKDPYQGEYSGTIGRTLGLIDMNGDGLVDRIVKSGIGFDVYYNNGYGFKQTPEFWADPIGVAKPQHESLGAIRAYATGNKLYLDIRDVNGDGLPDRVVSSTIYYQVNGETYHGNGITYYLNINGRGWAQPTLGTCFGIEGSVCSELDASQSLGALDPASSSEYFTVLSDSQRTLMDLNGDGYLDRVVGDHEAGKIKVYFYRGILTGSNDIHFAVTPLVLDDPAASSSLGEEVKGVISSGKVGFSDLNGDGYPDRVVSVQPTAGNNGKYVIYAMKYNALKYSDKLPLGQKVFAHSQPSNGLKGLDNGQGFKTAIEYLPSSYSPDILTRWNLFLPFNVFTVHKLYRQDPTVPTADTSYEAQRNKNMRFTTYWYRGGNLFVRYGYGSGDGSLYLPYVSRFNGFQKVEKVYKPMSGETWPEYREVQVFHQAIGDVKVAKDNVFPYFNADAYKHFSLSGKMYTRVLREGDVDRLTENYEWSTTGDPQNSVYANVDCPGVVCPVKFVSKHKETREAGSTSVASVKNAYTYDQFGNVTTDDLFVNGGFLLSNVYEYVPFGNFGTLQIKNKVSERRQVSGSSTYTKQVFTYDQKGNQLFTMLYKDAGSYNSISKEYFDNGNLKNVTDVNGVTKSFTYDSLGLFPIKETVNLAGVGKLDTDRDFLRLTGKVSRQIEPQKVGTQRKFDAFGRPTEEFIVRSDGGYVTTAKFVYDYVDLDVDGASTRVLRTEKYRTQPEYPETLFAKPAEISYTDGKGFVLQSCRLSERGDYRVTYARSFEAGRLNKITEAKFISGCEFASTFPTNIPFTVSRKDVLGRVYEVTPPAGEAQSPVDPVKISYKIEFGSLVKEFTLPKNQSRVETYDPIGRLTRVNGSIGDSVQFYYDPVGRLLTTQAGGSVVNKTKYDMLGNKIETVDADMGKWSYFYNNKGQLEKQTDAKGQSLLLFYDSIGRLSKKVYQLPDGSTDKTEVYDYDSGDSGYDVMPGELAKVTEYNKSGEIARVSKFSYDVNFRRMAKMTRTMPALGDFSQTFVHNSIGQISSTSYANAAMLYYRYNVTGGLWKVCDAASCDDKTSEVYYEVDPSTGYNEQGSLLEEKYGNGVKSLYNYYALSHRMSKKVTALDAKEYASRTFTYDAQSNIRSISDQLGLLGAVSIKEAKYDQANRLVSAELVGAPSIAMGYDQYGNVTKNTSAYGDNIYGYNGTKPHAVSSIGFEMFNYDANGNMTSDASREMTYNAANQLVKVVMKSGAVINYDYDYAGTRVLKHVVSKDTYGKAVDYSVNYLGNAIEIRKATDEVALNIFAAGKMVASRYIGTVNDVMGSSAGITGPPLRTILRGPLLPVLGLLSIALIFILAGCKRSLEEIVLRPGISAFPAKGSVIPAKGSVIPAKAGIQSRSHCERSEAISRIKLSSYPLALRAVSLLVALVLFFATPVALAGDAGNALKPASDIDYLIYHHGDHLGSTHLVTEGKKLGRHAGISYPRGSVIQRFEYLPWGQEAFALNPNQLVDPRFTGQEYDLESGLYFYKARYYNPALGRFIQPDTIVPSPSDPQSYNRYAYVRNNPLKYVDPSGHYVDKYDEGDASSDGGENSTSNNDGPGLGNYANALEQQNRQAINEIYAEGVKDGLLGPSNLIEGSTNSNRGNGFGAVDRDSGYHFDYSSGEFVSTGGGGVNWSEVGKGFASALSGGITIGVIAITDVMTGGVGALFTTAGILFGAAAFSTGVAQIISGFAGTSLNAPPTSLPAAVTYGITGGNQSAAEKVDFMCNATMLGTGLIGNYVNGSVSAIEATGELIDSYLLGDQMSVWNSGNKK